MNGVRIFGIGSPSGDDRAGWLTVDALQGAGLAGVELEKLDRPGASLISRLQDASRVILIDAMQGNGRAGDFQRFEQKDWPAYRHGLSSHGFGVLGALTLARELGCLPPEIELYGIEIDAAAAGAEAGQAVQAAAQRLAAEIVSRLQAAD